MKEERRRIGNQKEIGGAAGTETAPYIVRAMYGGASLPAAR